MSALCFPSSSSSSRRTWKYEVFLSFRGEDTRNSFTGHLYAALRRKGICTFKDDKKLQKGERIRPELLKAIEESQISIVVLSRNYADSGWCLDELAKICEGITKPGYTVLPIFYHVDPSDVRKQRGDFKEAFEKHVRNSSDKIPTWKSALKEVADLAGYDVRNKSESDVIDEIVTDVIRILQHKFSSEDELLNRDPSEDVDRVGRQSRLQQQLVCETEVVGKDEEALEVHKLQEDSADSDETWEAFDLPADWQHLVAQSSSPHLNSLPKKQLYRHLCDHPLLLADRTMSFCLDRESGKKCYMIGAMGLWIRWGPDLRYWNYPSIQESRFSEVAKLNEVWWFEVKGILNTKLLSQKTTYEVFFIFKFGSEVSGFTDTFINYSVDENGMCKCSGEVLLYPPRIGAKQRQDGWLEIKVGEFYTEPKTDGDGMLEFKLWEYDVNKRKKGILIEGFEFRPKCPK